MNSVEKLKNKVDNLSGLSEDTVLSIMVLSRVSLEELGLKNNFPLLNFYCNWCVHSELSSSSVCYDILLEITNILISNPKEEPTQPWFNDGVVEILNLKELRNQFINFFKRYSIKTTLFDNYNNWQYFTAYLRNIIAKKPIKFPDNVKSKKGNVKLIFDKIENISQTNNGLATKSLWVTSENSSNGSTSFFWNVSTFNDYITIQGGFVMNEHKF